MLERAELYAARRHAVFGLGVFFLALSLRLVYLGQIHLGIYGNLLKMEGTDCFLFVQWSFMLAEKGWLTEIDLQQSVLYTYFLTAVFKIFGTKVYIARLIQMLLGSLTCMMVFSIGRRSFSTLAGLLAGILAAAYGPMIFYDAAILRANLITFLNTLLVLIMLLLQKRPRIALFLPAGLVLGLCILAKPNIIIFIPGIIVWLWLLAKKQGLKKTVAASGLIIIGTALLLSLVFARNAALDMPIFSLTGKGKEEFISGNVPESPGVGWVVPDSTREIIERADGKMVGVIREVLKENREDPVGFIRQQFRKLGAFLNAYEVANNLSIYVEKRYVPFMRLPWPDFSLVLGLGLLGLAAGLRRWRELFPLYSYLLLYSLGTIAFYFLARFRLPIIPAMTVFAGGGAMMIIESLLGRRWLRAGALLVPAALAFWLSRPRQPDPLQISDYNNMARYHYVSGRPDIAREIWREGVNRAREILEDRPSAEAHYTLALFIFRTGSDLDEALDHLDKAEAMNPPAYLRSSIRIGRSLITRERLRQAGH